LGGPSNKNEYGISSMNALPQNCLRTGLVAGALALLAAVGPARADDQEWLPITPADLELKSDPNAPSAPAIYLYRQVDRDDTRNAEVIYERIKVLTEAGREYGNVQVPYIKHDQRVERIAARTIQPDGTITDFRGEIYDKPLLAARGVKTMTKSFSLPNVGVGTIVEYRYRQTFEAGYVFSSHWALASDLFTRHAKFSMRPFRGYSLRWSWPRGLPEGTAEPRNEDGIIRLETRNVPAFVTESLMPPGDTMKYRVDFIYDTRDTTRDPKKYWSSYSKDVFGIVDKFTRNRRALEQALTQIVQPTDSPEEKLRKIYRRLQQVRNLTYEPSLSEQEEKRAKLASIDTAEEVLKYGYGYEWQIARLMFGLARTAGIDAQYVMCATRDRELFDPRVMNPRGLNGELVLAKIGDRRIYLDVGTPFVPFGTLPWNETGVSALPIAKDGAEMTGTPVPGPSAARIERKGTLQLRPAGSLEGRVTITYSGIEAWWRRFAERNEDDTERTKYLENDLEGDVPVGVEVKLVNQPGWRDSETPLVAEYELKVPGWATAAGKRYLLAVGLFGAAHRHTFEHATRVQPIYFSFAHRHTDDITVELPPGFQVSSVPKARSAELEKAQYRVEATSGGSSLRLKRDFTINFVIMSAQQYPTLREFFQTVRGGDEDRIVVSRADVASAAH
jgi:uncharacterized protein DUF3857/transglutaminase superfamily protein